MLKLQEFSTRLQSSSIKGEFCKSRVCAPDKNMVRYSVEMIKNSKLEELWSGLQKSRSKGGIRSVGKKIASLYLRDLVTILGLEQEVSNNHQIFLQPIDT